jgi:hypothetical protein
MARIEPEIGVFNRSQAAHKQSGDDQQHQRAAQLGDDEDATRALAANCPRLGTFM